MEIKIIVGVILLAALAIDKIWNNKKCDEFEWYERQHRDVSLEQQNATLRALDAVLTEHQSIDDRLNKIERRLAPTAKVMNIAKTTRLEKYAAEQFPKMVKAGKEELVDMFCYLYDYDNQQPCDDCPACEYCDAKDRRKFLEWLLEEVPK